MAVVERADKEVPELGVPLIPPLKVSIGFSWLAHGEIEGLTVPYQTG